ncbi:MAG: TolC family protein [Edaphocola sp.]
MNSTLVKWTVAAAWLATAVAARAQDSTTQRRSLKDCISYGLAHHKSVQVAQNNIETAHQQAREQLAAYLPQVNVTAGLDYNLKLAQNIIPAGSFPSQTEEMRIQFGTKYASTQVIQLDQKIFDKSLLTGLKANSSNNQLAELNAEQNNQDLIYNISYAYYQILVTQKQLDLLYGNKERFEKILKVTRLQAEQGVVKKVDVKQVQVNLNNVLAQISVAENNLKLSQNTLNNYMGLPQGAVLQLTDTARWLAVSPNAGASSNFDYRQSVSYQLQATQIKMYDINRQSIRDQVYPTLSVYGRYGANGFGQESIWKCYDPLLDYSAIGLKLSWSLFTGFRRSAQYKQAYIDLENARINLKLNEDRQRLQYENAGVAVTRARTNISTNKQNMDLAGEVYENTTLQYRQGMATLSDLLNAENSYREAQNNYIASLLDFYLAYLDVQKANGTLRQYYQQL